MGARKGRPKPKGSGRPRGRQNKSSLAPDVKALAQQYTELAINALVGVVSDPDSPPQAKVSAANSILDRGWGKTPQAITGEGGKPLFPAKLVVELHPGVPPPALAPA